MRTLIFGLCLLGAGCATVEAPVVVAEGEALVRVSCGVREDGRLTGCQILSEQPVGAGFGEAALRAASESRLDAATVRGAPRGARVEYNIRFRPAGPATLDLQPPRA